jgi:hypothetical protein
MLVSLPHRRYSHRYVFHVLYTHVLYTQSFGCASNTSSLLCTSGPPLYLCIPPHSRQLHSVSMTRREKSRSWNSTCGVCCATERNMRFVEASICVRMTCVRSRWINSRSFGELRCVRSAGSFDGLRPGPLGSGASLTRGAHSLLETAL